MTKVSDTAWTYSWNVPSGSDGNVNVSIEATDNMTLSPIANYSTSKYIDNTNPTVSIEYSDSSTYIDDADTITVYANFTEAGSGMLESSIALSIDYLTGTDVSGASMTKVSNTEWTYSWDVPSASDGNVNVSIEGTDNVSLSPFTNWSTSKTIDNTAPTVTIEYSDSTTYFKVGDDVTVYANFTEAGSGILESTVKLSIDTNYTGDINDASMNKTSNTEWTYVWDVPPGSFRDGRANISIDATDNVSQSISNQNWSSSKIVDNTAPTLDYAVMDADNLGVNFSYVDVWFSEDTMDTNTIAFTDFNISLDNVDTAEVMTNTINNLTTLRFDGTFQTGSSPTIGVDGSIADLAGNTITSGTVTINTFRISLASGWNLFSTPADTSGSLISTVVSDIDDSISVIWHYNSSLSGVDAWSAWQDSGDDDHFYLEPGEGYWVQMSEARTLVGNYNLMPTGPTSPPTVTLQNDKWNLIGHWDTYNQTASTDTYGVFAGFVDADISGVYKFNTTSTGYENIWSYQSNMEPGFGYWMFLASDGNKVYSP